MWAIWYGPLVFVAFCSYVVVIGWASKAYKETQEANKLIEATANAELVAEQIPRKAA